MVILRFFIFKVMLFLAMGAYAQDIALTNPRIVRSVQRQLADAIRRGDAEEVRKIHLVYLLSPDDFKVMQKIYPHAISDAVKNDQYGIALRLKAYGFHVDDDHKTSLDLDPKERGLDEDIELCDATKVAIWRLLGAEVTPDQLKMSQARVNEAKTNIDGWKKLARNGSGPLKFKPKTLDSKITMNKDLLARCTEARDILKADISSSENQDLENQNSENQDSEPDSLRRAKKIIHRAQAQLDEEKAAASGTRPSQSSGFSSH